MKKRSRGVKSATLIIIIVCLLLGAAIVWGVKTMLAELADYGSNASIGSSVTDETAEEDTELDTSIDSLPLNTYDPDGFYTENGLRRYDSEDVIGLAGIDVSSYQDTIDWKQVKEAGVDFAMIRLGYRGYVSGKLDLDIR